MAANGRVRVNATNDAPPDNVGFFTYNIDPNDCTASDFRYFNMHQDPNQSTNLINYLQGLADGKSLFYWNL